MDRLIEFAGHHAYLAGTFVALLIAYIVTEMQRGGRTISAHDLTRLVNQQQARLIDLRNAPEFREGHITGSENLPFTQFSERTAEIAKAGKPVVLVCALGQTAGNAAQLLKKAGLEEVYRLDNGISGWRQLGLPLVR